MKMRKLMAVALALVTLCAMAVPAFAFDESLELGGTTTVPIISLAMPADAENVTLNPYKLEVAFAKTSVPAKSTAQIASPLLLVKNLSNCQLKVVIKASAAVAGEAKLSETTIASTDTYKSVYLTMGAKIIDTVPANQDEIDALSIPENTGSGFMVIKKSAAEMTGFASDATAAKANVLAAASKVERDPATANGILALQLGGAMNEKPKTDWTEADTATVNIAFSFTPVSNVNMTASG